MIVVIIFFILNRFIFTAFGGSGFSTFLEIRRLLAFLRARLSTLLYKSIKHRCLLDFVSQTYSLEGLFPSTDNFFLSAMDSQLLGLKSKIVGSKPITTVAS
jgi:hypothetical protein